MISAWQEERNNGIPCLFTCPCCSAEYCQWNRTEDRYPETLSTEATLRLSQIGLQFMARITRKTR